MDEKNKIHKQIMKLMDEATIRILDKYPDITMEDMVKKSEKERLELYKEVLINDPAMAIKFMELSKEATKNGLNPFSLLQPEKEQEKKPPQKFALFYGFNGILEKQYSVITDKTEEEINARMAMVKVSIPWSIHKWEEFEKIIIQFKGTENELKEIPFEDAMSILRVGALNEFEKFIESEVEEFTDKCIAGVCKPGDHHCGK